MQSAFSPLCRDNIADSVGNAPMHRFHYHHEDDDIALSARDAVEVRDVATVVFDCLGTRDVLVFPVVGRGEADSVNDESMY
jgi:hypothetical protein